MARITIEDLKSFLWSAAEDLRGQIDAAGYKEYIFPLLFFKRISDVYDEQYAAFVAEGGEEYAHMQAAELAIRIPDGQHWQDVRQVTEDVGQRLVEAFIAIEQANPAREADGRLVGGLDGIFGPKDGWTNKQKMPDHIITSIIENFSRYNLSLANCPADEMGQAYEYLVVTSSIARMNLYLNGVEDFSIACGDTLRQPAFIDGSRLRTFDMVLANPPYSIKAWDRAAFEHDKWGRNMYGTPPQARADYAFIQHIIASMNENTGRCAILLPHGVLFRKEERDIRQKLIEADVLECVIGIGKNLFYNSGMDACIMICRKRKPEERKNKILFIDAHELVTHTSADTYLEPWHIAQIVDAYNRFVDLEGFAAIVDCKAINDFNKSKLSIKRYVRPAREILSTTAEEHYEEWEQIAASTQTNINQLLNCF